MLEKTRFIQVKPQGWTKGADFGQVFFCCENDPDEEDAQLLHELKMDKSVWQDMGCPNTITVTIEPGDKLND